MSGYANVVQERNSEMVDILRTDFQHLNEPNFAWKSASSVLQTIPGIVAAWPMSVIRRDSATDRVRDIAGGAYHLSEVNTNHYGYDNLVPWAEFNGVDSYLQRADGGAADWADVLGTEGHIEPGQRGLTFGGWFRFDDPAGAIEGLIVKRGAVTQYAYTLYRVADGTVRCEISDDGTNTDVATSTLVTVKDTWYFIVGRFEPSAFVELYLSGTWYQTVTARASVHDSTANLAIGSFSTAWSFMDGKTSLCFLSQMYLSDAIVFSFYQQTRAMFGV